MIKIETNLGEIDVPFYHVFGEIEKFLTFWRPNELGKLSEMQTSYNTFIAMLTLKKSLECNGWLSPSSMPTF